MECKEEDDGERKEVESEIRKEEYMLNFLFQRILRFFFIKVFKVIYIGVI